MANTVEQSRHDEHRCLQIKSNKQITEVFEESEIANEGTIYTQSAFSTPKNNSQTKTSKNSSDKTMSNSFTRVRSFVFCLSLLQLVQVMGSGYGKSALTSIERRYRLNTFSIGVLQSCFPIGNLSVILFVSYFGSKWHRPRAIAVGSMVMALSSLVSCLPQFLGERYNTEFLQDVKYPSSQSNTITNFPSTIRNGQLTDIDDLPQQILNLQLVERNNDSLFVSTSGRTKFDQYVFANDLFQRQPSGEVVKVDQNKAPSSQPVALSRLVTADDTQENYHINSVADDKNKSTYQTILTAFNGSVRHQLCKPLTMPSMQWEFIQSNRMEKLSAQKNNDDDSFLYIFIAAGSVLKGMGHSPLHPLGMSFIDDFASGSNSAVYIGVISALSLLGPAFGFILGSLTANIWVDSGWVNTTNISIRPQDSLWVGAWWMGYLITGCLLIVATMPFFAFPRVIDKEEENVNEKAVCFSRVEACLSDDDNEDSEAVFGDCKDHYIECEKTEKHVELITRDDAIVGMTLGLRQDSNDATSKSMDFEPNTRQLFPIDSETIRTNGSQSMCYCVDDVPSTFNGTRLMHYGRFRRSASTPAIHAAHLRRAARAFSLHPSDCVFDKKVLNRTLQNSPSNASMKDFAFTLRGLLRDPVFISITLGFVSLTSFLASSITFVSKYMETQFDLSASHANLLNGCVNLPMAVVGNLLGGWIIRKRNLTVKRTLNVVLVSLFMTSLAVAFLLFWGCESNDIVGIGDSSLSSSSSCIKSCRCDDIFAPVCQSTLNITYRSPCHAGCTQMNIEDGVQTFSECRCLVNQALTDGVLPNGNLNGKVHTGACPKLTCSHALSVFVVVMGTASMTAGMSSTPSTLTILRVVPPTDKAFAIGIVFVFTRVLAWIPAPVYVGSAIDISCLLWIDSCQNKFTPTGRHHCELYDKRLLRQIFFGCTSLQLLLSSCFYGLALYLVTRRDKERGKLQPGHRCDHV